MNDESAQTYRELRQMSSGYSERWSAALVAAEARIAELEAELAAAKWYGGLLRDENVLVQRDEARARLAAVLALCDDFDYVYGANPALSGAFDGVRAAATGDHGPL